MSRGSFGLAGHSWAQTGLSAVDRIDMDYPGLAFPCESQFSTCQTMAGEAEGEKQQHFIAMTTKTPQKKKKGKLMGRQCVILKEGLKVT